MNNRDLEERLIQFAVLVIEMIRKLPKSLEGEYLAGQVVRSAASSALNYGEAQAAESRRDFIHKNRIVNKELRETFVNLKIIHRAKLIPNADLVENVLKENNELISIFVALIKKAQSNQ